MTKPETGSLWWAAGSDQFRVIDVVELNGHTWVHYCRTKESCIEEYSCYLESFLQRFTEIKNDSRSRI